jgi:saccharopine dehydrogenase (NAD+, L-lysine-forming)
VKVLVLGSGAVGTVSALTFGHSALVDQLIVADAVPTRATQLAARIAHPRVTAVTLCARDRAAVVRTLRESGTSVLLNAALPNTNLDLMRACLDAGCDYIDMAMGGAADDGIPKLEDQLALDGDFRAAGRTALLGMGADPGTTNIYAAYAAKHLLDDITELRVRDGDSAICCAHDGGFLPAFSPWVFIDECLCGAVSWRDGQLRTEEPLSGREPFDFPELGVLDCYHVDHEEVKMLSRRFPATRLIDFKLCLGDSTLQTLRVLKQTGLSRTDRIRVGDAHVAPRDVVVSLLPEPGALAGHLQGKTCVGTLARGLVAGEPRAFYVFNVTDHERAFATLGVQGTAYQTGIPPVIAAELLSLGLWRGTGVKTPEEFDPDPFLARLGPMGMPWYVRDDTATLEMAPSPPGRRAAVATAVATAVAAAA